MVSQSQDGMGWDGSANPSRTGSLLSLDGRQRPAPAKTPPSYYDAVRSRHSLSQPRTSDGSKQDKGHPVQQVKYNSLPRPLPQRYPPTSANGQQHRPWPDDHYDPGRANPNQPWRPGDPSPRQLYDSPPKPANHVPLQLQVHSQERYLVKRCPEQTESCKAPGFAAPRGSDQPRQNGGPRADRLTVDCGARGNPVEMMRKESIRGLPPCPDVRTPPVQPGVRMVQPRILPSPGGHRTNSLQRRDQNESSGLIRRCYTMSPDGSPAPSNYPARSSMNGISYEPRYSKSGKLCPRPLSQGFESRPMPPPAIQLRTGPLGSYPDAETLKRSEMMAQNRSYEDFNRQAQKTPSHGDISQQIYVETNNYTNGQSVITDHLAIPYRIPQVSPKNPGPLFENCNGVDNRKEISPGLPVRGSHSVNGIKGIKNQQLSCPKSAEDHATPLADLRCRRVHENNTLQYNDSLQTYNNKNMHNFNKHSSSPDKRSEVNDNNVIYANHQMSFNSGAHGPDHRSVQKRTPPVPNGNSVFYENHHPSKSCPREVHDMSFDDNAVYANHLMASSRYSSSQQEISTLTPDFHNDKESNFRGHYNNLHNKQHPKQLPPPPVAQKPRPTLPQPSEMIMVTETRGWNGQVNSYPKDLVKPTPRMPRLANVASGTQLTTVPAYQCVINELSRQNGTQSLPRSSDSSTLSLRSGYDSSSSSVRDFGRQPSKSDSFIDMKKLSEGELNSASSQQHIDKNFLSASLTSLCSDASSSISTRRYHRYHHEDPNWDRMNEEFQKRKDKGSVFSASPWEREEKEKLQQEQLLDARRARDQEIALLESLPERNEKQEEWLRILRLEREFQRRAEQELKDDEDEDEEDEDVLEKHPIEEKNEKKVESFHGDTTNLIPNERHGLKLLDELLENSSKSCSTVKPEYSKSPSEIHFIPVERTISDNVSQTPTMPTAMINAQNSEHGSNHLQKPPIPAPRPSKAIILHKSDSQFHEYCNSINKEAGNQIELDSKIIDSSTRDLAKIDLSDSGFYHGNTNINRDYLQDNNWLIEVPSFENGSPDIPVSTVKQNGEREESRIYENIMEFQSQKLKTSSQNGYGSHTLPKTNCHLTTKEVTSTRNNLLEKKFPAMGVSSTLSRKLNGHTLSDNDILPSLYASSKVKNCYQRDIPSEIEDKSPEFKKLWVSRPEKLTFQDKIRKFSLQAGEDDLPRDRVKNSRAQREIEIKFNEGQKKSASTSEA